MSLQIKDVLVSEEEINAKISELASDLNRDYAGCSVMIVGILKGCFIFIGDLIRQLDFDLSVHFMEVSSYGKSTKSSGIVKITKDLEVSIEGREVLIIEDIVDSGLTLNYMKNLLQDRKPASIRVCAMLNKPERRRSDVQIDYLGFDIPDAFVVGYGLDYAEKFRQLPFIAVAQD